MISDYYHAWHKGLLWKNLTSIPLFRLMQFSGTYRGFSQRSKITSDLRHTFYYPNRRKVSGNVITERENNHKHPIDYTKTVQEDIDGKNN